MACETGAPEMVWIACCPPNLARLLSSIGSYAYTEKRRYPVCAFVWEAPLKKIGEDTATIQVKARFFHGTAKSA